jgi:hypothetical protein
MQSRYLPALWRTGVSVLLLEKEWVTLIEKLRTAILFQPASNYMRKFIGRQMTKNSEFYDQLAWEQYGSQSVKKAIHQAWNQVLVFDIIRQAMRDAGL